MPDLSPSAQGTTALSHLASPQPSRDDELTTLVHRARAGDEQAWASLVQRFDRILRHVARSYRLAPADVDEVIQATWLELLEGIGRIREPAAIGAWLSMVTRRKALRVKQLPVREQLTGDSDYWERPDPEDCETSLFAAERRSVLAGAVDALPEHHRRLVTVLLTEPALGYCEVSERLAMPIGSIGPTRARALERLACDERLRAVSGPV
jgi:RNA polymerase sigma factor (sigma-70 family)